MTRHASLYPGYEQVVKSFRYGVSSERDLLRTKNAGTQK